MGRWAQAQRRGGPERAQGFGGATNVTVSDNAGFWRVTWSGFGSVDSWEVEVDNNDPPGQVLRQASFPLATLLYDTGLATITWNIKARVRGFFQGRPGAWSGFVVGGS